MVQSEKQRGQQMLKNIVNMADKFYRRMVGMKASPVDNGNNVGKY